MSFSLQKIECPPSFPDGFVQGVIIDPGTERIRRPGPLAEIVKEIRRQHSGVILFGRDFVSWEDCEEDDPVQNDETQMGFHIHRGYDTVNVSKGSNIPTVIAYNVKACALAVIAAIDDFMAPLRDAAPEKTTAQVLVHWLDNCGYHVEKLSVLEHLEKMRDGMLEICRGPEISDIAKVWRIFDHWRNFLGTLHSRLRNALYHVSQGRVPEDQKIYLYPDDLAAYVIPADILHARSAVHGSFKRPEAEINTLFTIDTGTGEVMDSVAEYVKMAGFLPADSRMDVLIAAVDRGDKRD